MSSYICIYMYVYINYALDRFYFYNTFFSIYNWHACSKFEKYVKYIWRKCVMASVPQRDIICPLLINYFIYIVNSWNVSNYVFQQKKIRKKEKRVQTTYRSLLQLLQEYQSLTWKAIQKTSVAYQLLWDVFLIRRN